MKIVNLIFILLTASIFACTNSDKPKMVYAPDSIKTDLIVDTSAVTIAELPIHFDSTEYLLFIIGKIHNYERGSKIYLGSGSSGVESFSVSYFDGDSFTGDIDNIKFQHIDSTSIRTLTKEQLKIRSFWLLHSSQNFILLEITDKDSNNDQQLTYEDIASLYISNENGTKFKKMSPQNHQLLDWKFMPIAQRVHFRTIEDIDHNGEFDKYDRIHQYFISLEENKFETTEIHLIDSVQ